MDDKALSLISLQHEFGMAIGCDSDLTVMLKIFLRVCLTRLDLTSVHVYLEKGANGFLIKATDKGNGHTKIEHFLSIPKRKEISIYHQCDLLSLQEHRQQPVFNEQSNVNLYRLEIPNHGLLIFESRYVIAEDILKALEPILKKLARACYSSIIHGALLQEIEVRKRAERQIQFQASHDGLTNLFNRAYFNGLLVPAFKESIRTGSVGCCIQIGLDRFKTVTDTMGHAVGETILITIAQRLQALARLDINIARLREDEFIILLPDLGLSKSFAQQRIVQVIEKINRIVEQPIFASDSSYKINCSIGYSLFATGSMSVSDVLKYADIAMNEARHQKPLIGVMFTREMLKKIENKAAYINEIKQALIGNEFELYYQPQFDDEYNIIGAEALLRWNNPNRGMESPEQYIKIAEDSDLIVPIGKWVIEKTCRDIATLVANGLPEKFIKISLNVSPKQLIQQDFKSTVISAVQEAGINPGLLGLEITENVLIDRFEYIIKIINQLKQYGIEFSIDDFGTGYSSLAYLKHIPATLIKIDRSFVIDVDKNPENEAIVAMILALGKGFKMKVIAEGVSNKHELAMLIKLGCICFQGYQFGKPMPFSEFVELVASQNNTAQVLS